MFGIGSAVDVGRADDGARRRDRVLRLRLGIDRRRIAALVADRRRHLEHRRDARDDRAHPALDQVLHRGVEAAHGAAQHDFLRDHVPGVAAVDLRDADDARFERMQVARDDRLQRADGVRREQHRILPVFGIAACAPLPVAMISKMSNAPISGPTRVANVPKGFSGQLCMPYTARIGNRSKRPSSTITRPPPSFSSAGWKMKYTVPSKSLLSRERRGRAQQHRRVAVVTARVHLALDLRRVRDAGFLVDVQRIEVGAQADRVGAGSAAKHADDAGLRESRVHVEPERAQLVGDERARRRFLERGLRVRVDVVSPGLDVGNEGGDFGNDGHGDSADCRIGRSRDVSVTAPGRRRREGLREPCA